VARGSILELLRPDEAGRVVSVCATNVFAVIRSLMPFRLQGEEKNIVVLIRGTALTRHL
jgi:splicing factor 3B subunit 3